MTLALLQQVLMSRSAADDDLDVAYTFDLVPPAENDTSEHNVTAVKVNIADILPNKLPSNGEPELWPAGNPCQMSTIIF